MPSSVTWAHHFKLKVDNDLQFSAKAMTPLSVTSVLVKSTLDSERQFWAKAVMPSSVTWWHPCKSTVDNDLEFSAKAMMPYPRPGAATN